MDRNTFIQKAISAGFTAEMADLVWGSVQASNKRPDKILPTYVGLKDGVTQEQAHAAYGTEAYADLLDLDGVGPIFRAIIRQRMPNP